MQQAIGIIDSGVGGITVAKEVMRQLPMERIVYFGDTARCPYGPRPPEEIRQFTLQMIRYLLKFHIKALVIACNTATAVVLQEIQEKATMPIIGVIEPGARSAVKMTKNGRIGVIGTVGTINSGAYEKVLRKLNPEITVYSCACPTFVPLVESGEIHSAEAIDIVEEGLAPLLDKGIDTLILGCTHYPLLADHIQKIMGSSVQLISSADETAREISEVLSSRGMLSKSFTSAPPVHRFLTSGNQRLFKSIAEEWLGQSIDVRYVNLDDMTNGFQNPNHVSRGQRSEVGSQRS